MPRFVKLRTHEGIAYINPDSVLAFDVEADADKDYRRIILLFSGVGDAVVYKVYVTEVDTFVKTMTGGWLT